MLPYMDHLWPDQTLVPEFQRVILDFEQCAWQLGMQALSCCAEKLGFAQDFFTQTQRRDSAEYQSRLRLLHYLPLAEGAVAEAGIWRAAAHTDFDCLTMIFQKTGQGNLQVCPDKETLQNQEWISVIPQDDITTCNMLMRRGDDKLKLALHRMRMPKSDEVRGPHYSVVFFCQANKDVMIQEPEKMYEAISARDYLRQCINANFSAIQAAETPK